MAKIAKEWKHITAYLEDKEYIREKAIQENRTQTDIIHEWVQKDIKLKGDQNAKRRDN